MRTLQQIFTDYDCKVRSYSGRGMYGATCLGVEFDKIGDVLAAIANAGKDAEHWREELQGACHDSMGRGMILYFPNVDYDKSDDGDECTYCDKRAVRRINGMDVCGSAECAADAR